MNDRLASPDPPTPGPAPPAEAPRRRWRWLRLRRPSRFLTGVIVGILALQGFREFVDDTTVIDDVLAPLLPMDTAGKGDVIVVLGAGVNKRCVPNNFGIQRLLTASRAYAEGRAPLVLITGGRPRGVTCTVAGAMAELGIKFGIPADRIRLENASRNTWQNALYSDPILKQLGAKRLVLVTDRLHMPRAEGCFRALGYETERFAVHSPDSHPDNMSMLAFAGHEVVGLAYYWLRGRVSFETPVHAAAPADMPGAGGAAAPGAAADTGRQALLRRHPGGPVVILGASYAAGWHPTVKGVPIVNKGAAGQQSFELRARFDADVVAQQPRAVVIWGYINDIFRSSRDQVPAAKTRAKAEFEAMVAAARAQGIEPILTTEATIRGKSSWSDSIAELVGWVMGKTSYQSYINGHVLELNTWVRAYAAREGLLLLDLHPVLSQADGQRKAEFANEDGSHIPAAGYAAIDRYAVPILERHFASTP